MFLEPVGTSSTTPRYYLFMVFATQLTIAAESRRCENPMEINEVL